MEAYTCAICGKTEAWDETTWAWFGSVLDLERKGIAGITVTCSQTCREKFCAANETVPSMEVTNG
ncbi:MAG: hypothetical protein PHO83_03760 [Geobacteraceae bacterium]|nr:hypothetical protein [Geobacteraceae bacterium]